MGADVEKVVQQNEDAKDFTDIVGGYGPWQRGIFYIFFLVYVPCAWHSLSMSFLAPNVGHWCVGPTDANVSVEVLKRIIPSKNSYLVNNNSHRAVDGNQCYRRETVGFEDIYNSTASESNRSSTIASVNTSILVPCQKWIYDNTEYNNTVVSQWNLVCDREWMVSLTKSIFMAGFLVSLFTFGQMADKIGRKPVLMLCAVIFLVSGVICACSLSFVMFAVSRFCVAVGISGMLNTGFVILMEVVSAKYRSEYGMAVNLGWSTGFVVLPGIAWLVRDWVWLQLSLTLPWVIFIAFWWLVPESPRWLLTQGKVEKAEEIMHKIAKANGRKISEVEPALKKLCAKTVKEQNENGKDRNGNLLDLLKTPRLRQYTLNLYFNWFVNSFIYYGLSYNTNELAGDPFVNFAIFGATEFPAYLIAIFVIKKMGRRYPLMGAMVAGGLACLATLPVPRDYVWVSVFLAMFGKFCITASFGIVYVYSAEIFPTVVRNTGIGTSSMFARLGSIIAPFVKELEHATHPSFPLACYGILSIISGLLVLFLPETNKCRIPDTLQEASALGKKRDEPNERETQDKQICKVHNENGTTKFGSLPKKIASDFKKLPDVVEEPSVFDEEEVKQEAEEAKLEEQNESAPIDFGENETVAEKEEEEEERVEETTEEVPKVKEIPEAAVDVDVDVDVKADDNNLATIPEDSSTQQTPL